MHTRTLLAAMAAAACATGAARADTDDVGIGTRVYAGISPGARTRMLDMTSAALADLGAINPSLAGIAGSTSTLNLRYSDAFRAGPIFGMELDYRIGNGFEPFARFVYDDAIGRSVPMGNISEGASSAQLPIVGAYSNLPSVTLDFGSRFVFRRQDHLQPFVSAYAGMTRVSALEADISSPQATTDLGIQRLLPSTTRADGGMEFGFDYVLPSGVRLGMTVGANYLAAETAATAALQSLGVPTTVAHGQGWTYPMQLGVSYHF